MGLTSLAAFPMSPKEGIGIAGRGTAFSPSAVVAILRESISVYPHVSRRKKAEEEGQVVIAWMFGSEDKQQTSLAKVLR